MTVDSLGTWIDIGTLQLTRDFSLYDVPCLNGEIFRFTYRYDNERWTNRQGRRSKILLRFYYSTESNNVSPSVVIYPKQEKEIRNLQDKLSITGTDLSTYTFYLGAKMYAYGNAPFNFPEDIPLELGIEYLVLENLAL